MTIAKYEVLAGDFRREPGVYDPKSRTFYVRLKEKMWIIAGTRIPLDEVESIEMASEESVKRVSGTVGWGLAGAAALGGVGLLAGLLAGGKATDVVFICRFKDGRKFMARADSRAYGAIAADLFEQNGSW